jgi:Flp pilus assembly protein TadD
MLLDEAVKKQPESDALGNSRAAIWIRQGRYDEAEGHYRKVLAEHSADTRALNNLSWLLALRDPSNASEALELINRAIELQGDDAGLVDTRAIVRLRLGDREQIQKAVDELSGIRGEHPRNPDFAFHLALALQKSGLSDQARAEFLKSTELGMTPRLLDPLILAAYQQLRKELFPQ